MIAMDSVHRLWPEAMRLREVRVFSRAPRAYGVVGANSSRQALATWGVAPGHRRGGNSKFS